MKHKSSVRKVTATMAVVFFLLLLGTFGRLDTETITFVHGVVLSATYLLGLIISVHLYTRLRQAKQSHGRKSAHEKEGRNDIAA